MKKAGLVVVSLLILCCMNACTFWGDNNGQTENYSGEKKVSYTIDEQLKVILDNKEMWEKDLELDSYAYAVTDLDHNGRLEIISSYFGGTGLYTYSSIYEVNEKGDGLQLCPSNLEEGESNTDLIIKDWNCYYDTNTNTYHYLLNDVVRISSFEHQETMVDFVLKDGKVTETFLATEHTSYQDDDYVTTYQRENGETMDRNAYDHIDETVYPNIDKKIIHIEWIMSQEYNIEELSKEELLQLLTNSYKKYEYYPMAQSVMHDNKNITVEDKERMAAYEEAIQNLYTNGLFPDGEAIDFDEYLSMSDDQYAICDIDQDGKDELIISHTATYMAGMSEVIYEYDTNTHQFKREMIEFPNLTYYENGVIEAGWSHNQGKAGDNFWPYTLYQYDKNKDQYVMVANVDAWDRSYTEGYYEEQPFPSNADKNGNGIVFYIMDENFSYDNPIDDEEYESWRQSYIKDAKEVRVPFIHLTIEY